MPETARFLSARLWRFFGSPVIDPPTVEQMAQAYLQSGGQMAPVLRALFRSESFYSPAAVGSLVRSPVELTATTYRTLGLPVGREAAIMASRMGQVLYDPPNVAGWLGGGAWLGSSILLNRLNFGEAVRYLIRRQGDAAPPLDAESPAALVDG